jgi:hypothetical protein
VPFGLRADRLNAGLSAVSRDTSSGFVDRHRKDVLDLVEVYTGIGQQVPILTMKAVPNDLVDTMRDRRTSIRNDVEFLVGVFAAIAMSPQDKRYPRYQAEPVPLVTDVLHERSRKPLWIDRRDIERRRVFRARASHFILASSAEF